MTPCPPADRLLGFASGELSDDQSASIESHIDSCIECRGVLSNMARGDVPPCLGRYRIDTVLGSGDGRAIVTDFGLARGEDKIDPNASTLSTDPHLTATGAIAGTPAYLAPEQLTGDPIDARVDQFAWAVMAWELLTGMKPFPI